MRSAVPSVANQIRQSLQKVRGGESGATIRIAGLTVVRTAHWALPRAGPPFGRRGIWHLNVLDWPNPTWGLPANCGAKAERMRSAIPSVASQIRQSLHKVRRDVDDPPAVLERRDRVGSETDHHTGSQ